ncbi:TlpA family protein disulfide reductase [Sphingobacterium sp. lm-10]|uniref:TlpA family protein disulfide reductase n=1 Tax=Sphingobacterium sp. lm-10 TaxID=2944904 RepID=UPI00201FEFF0|nr:TlpA family protein disulfide reductase [Sphingobacterium sp. lm-10]MCL7987088.1 TlpA family protein disulfide reductase [Sphingobacterium sp. lm-10]
MTFLYDLAALWPKPKNNFKALARLSILLMLSAYLFIHRAVAQSRSDSAAGVEVTEVSPIFMGEKVPDEFWTQEHLFYSAGDTIRGTLEQFKGKLLILDFWATWCGACRTGFAKLDKFTQQYPDDVVFVLVNPLQYKDSFEKIDQCYKNVLPKIGGTSLPSIIFDEKLIAQFPHRLIPNYVWISKNGFIRAFTGGGGLVQDIIDYHIDKQNL